MDKEQMAEQIYLQVYGHLDDKDHRAHKQTEILDWLTDGDLDGTEEVDCLATQWFEREWASDHPDEA